MKVIFSEHAKMRMKGPRQRGITPDEVKAIAESFPGIAPEPHGYKIKNNISKAGKQFDIVIVDKKIGRKVITVIGL